MSRASQVTNVAPVAPPCFSSRDQWLTYLESAAAEQRALHAPGPLLFEKGEPVRFNPSFRYCKDCPAQHSLAMTRAGKCEPDYLIDLFKAEAKPAEEAKC